jgi:hypothetical protein
MTETTPKRRPPRCPICGRFVGKAGCWTVEEINDPAKLKEALGL